MSQSRLFQVIPFICLLIACSDRSVPTNLETTLGRDGVALTVTPANATLSVAGAQQYTATDPSGRAVSAKWSISDTTIARISASGLLTARSAGSAVVTARNGRNQGTTTVTVTSVNGPPPPPNPLVSECSTGKPEWIWCDDFEQDRLTRYFEYVSNNGSFTRAASVGLQASSGMRARWGSAGQVSAGNLKVAFGRTPTTYMRPVDAGAANYREIYWRVFIRTQSGWTGGGYKFTRAMIFANANWAEAMIAHLWTGSTTTHLTMDPASGTDAAGNLKTTTYNDFANLRWLGATAGSTTLFDSGHAGQWHCVETHVRLNDAGTANGVFEFWVNGVLQARRTDLNWVGSYNAYGINSVFLENYWNNGAPQAQERYFDNLVVSKQPIGCT